MPATEHTRRRTLALAGSAMTAAVAGCTSVGIDQLPTADTDDASGDDSSDGHAHDHDVDHAIGHPEAHVEVTMETDDDGHHFVPHVVHVEPGGTVSWVLESGVHDTVAYHPDNANLLPTATDRRIPDGTEPWASDVYDDPDDGFDRTFDEAGVYDYTCTIVGHGHRGGHHDGDHHGGHTSHESAGMVGRVIVGEPSLEPEDQPAMGPPSDDLPETARDELHGYNHRTRDGLEGH